MLNQYQFAPPRGYYDQPLNTDSPPDAEDLSTHLTRLGHTLNGIAHMTSDGESHLISVHHHGDGMSYLNWEDRQSGGTRPSFKPGEIRMIKSKQPGAASVIHDAARAIARDHPNIAFPKHSEIRTIKGAQWVHNEQVRHGEQLWGLPMFRDSPAYDAWEQQGRPQW